MFLVSAEPNGVALYLGCPAPIANHLIAQMHAHHLGVSMVATVDPLIGPQRVMPMTPAKPDVFNLRRIFATDVADPLAGLLACLARTDIPGNAAVEVTFTPVTTRRALSRLMFVASVAALDLPNWAISFRLSQSWRRIRC